MELSLSIFAILISFASLVVSAWVALRDRSNLKTHCSVFRSQETNEYSHLYIKAVNTGRRPITILYFMGMYTDKHKSGYQIKNGGARLNEGDYWEEKIGKFDGMMISDVGEGDMVDLIDLYLEDTSGKQYPVSEAKLCIEKLQVSEHAFGTRTH